MRKVRANILEIIKDNFEKLALWKDIESPVAIKCSELPEADNEKNKEKLVTKLYDLRDYLMSRGISKEELRFLTEEAERYAKTTQMSLYVTEEDKLPQEIIEKYARTIVGTEGIVGIHKKLTYPQLRNLTNGVFEKTGMVKFYISREKTILGQIVAEIFEYPQNVPIATVIRRKRRSVDEAIGKEQIVLFGDRIDKNKFDIIREILSPFYVYRLITENNQEYILFSVDRQEIGEYLVTGVSTNCNDYKPVSTSAKLPTKLPYFFAQSMKNRILKYKNHDEFKPALLKLNVNPDALFEFPFTMKKNYKTFLLKQPEWFKWLIWSWLLHERKGLFNTYPMHIMWIGPQSSGKSVLMNSLHARSKENRSIFSGSSSTLKKLVPSFKGTPAQLGYLAESNRFAYCDELLRCIMKVRNASGSGDRDESVAMMNDLLEHQKREAGSGVSSVHVNMTARILAGTNPVRNVHNMGDLLHKFDKSFLSRWLIYNQSKEHIKMIRDSNDADLEQYSYDLHINEWISMIDYLQSFSAEYDMKRMKKIYESVKPLLSGELLDHYSSRHQHHLECLLDGVIKTRCILETDMSFKAQDKDYDKAEQVWKHVIGSWIDFKDIRKMDVGQRIYYLPEPTQFLYWSIAKQKRPVIKEEIIELCEGELTPNQRTQSLVILREMELIFEDGDEIKTHYMRSIK